MCWRAKSFEQTCHAQVLIRVGPVNSITIAQELPVLPLLFGGIEQPWEPLQRYRQSSSIGQLNTQFVFRDLDVSRQRPHLNG